LSECNLTSEYNVKQASDRMKIVAKLRQYSKQVLSVNRFFKS